MQDKIDVFLHVLNKTIPELKNLISISVSTNYEYSTKLGLLKEEKELIVRLPNESTELYSKVKTILDFCDVKVEYQVSTFETMEFKALI